MVKTLPSNAEGTGSIPDQRTKIPHATGCGQNKQTNKQKKRNNCSPQVVLLWYYSLTSASTCPHLLPWFIKFHHRATCHPEMPPGELSPNFLRTFPPWRVRTMLSFQWRRRVSCQPVATWSYRNTLSRDLYSFPIKLRVCGPHFSI